VSIMLAGVGVGVSLFQSAVTVFMNAVCRLVCKVARSDCWHCHGRPPVCPSVWNNSAATGRICMKFDILSIFRKFENIRISVKYDKNKGYFT
jgi:hypothetical protein